MTDRRIAVVLASATPAIAVVLLGTGLVRSWKDAAIAAACTAAICLTAAAVQFLLYASYTVWWAGHTYGPRYMLDILPLLVPLAALTAGTFRRPPGYSIAGLTLAWSILVSSLGAFNYPNDLWNSSPLDVDRAHERLWDWSDNQIARAWKAGASPQNFDLASRGAFRVPNP